MVLPECSIWKNQACLCLVILVEVFDAVDVVGSVHGKGNAVQTPMADHTGEALGMIGLPSRP